MKSNVDKERELYNSLLIDSYIKLIERKYHYISIEQLLNDAGMTREEVENPKCWFNQTQVNRFHDRLRNLTGKKDIAREAGLFAGTEKASGSVRGQVLKLMGPSKAYKMISKYSKNFNRASDYKARKLGRKRFEIVVTLVDKDIQEQPFQCENRKGYLEAIARLFTTKPAKVEHPVCMHSKDKGKHCKYIVSWEEDTVNLWRWIGYISSLLSIISLVISIISPSLFCISTSLIFIIVSYIAFLKEKHILKATINEWHSLYSLMDTRLTTYYDNSHNIFNLRKALSKATDIDKILGICIDSIKARFDRGIIFIADSQKGVLKFRKGFGFDNDDEYEKAKGIAFNINKPESKGEIVRCFNEKIPFLVDDIDKIKDNITYHSQGVAMTMGVNSFICCPINYDDEGMGVLTVDNFISDKRLSPEDREFLIQVGRELGMSIKHNNLQLELQKELSMNIQIEKKAKADEEKILLGRMLSHRMASSISRAKIIIKKLLLNEKALQPHGIDRKDLQFLRHQTAKTGIIIEYFLKGEFSKNYALSERTNIIELLNHVKISVDSEIDKHKNQYVRKKRGWNCIIKNKCTNPNLYVTANKDLLWVAMENLVINAEESIKNSRKSGIIRLYADEHGDTVKIGVKSDGPPISIDRLDYVKTVLKSSGNRQELLELNLLHLTHNHNHGLGLKLVVWIVKGLFDGNVELVSRDSETPCFEITLKKV